jgi:hypothetical protein
MNDRFASVRRGNAILTARGVTTRARSISLNGKPRAVAWYAIVTTRAIARWARAISQQRLGRWRCHCNASKAKEKEG